MRHHSSWIMRKEMRVEPRESGIEAASGWKDESTRKQMCDLSYAGLEIFLPSGCREMEDFTSFYEAGGMSGTRQAGIFWKPIRCCGWNGIQAVIQSWNGLRPGGAIGFYPKTRQNPMNVESLKPEDPICLKMAGQNRSNSPGLLV